VALDFFRWKDRSKQRKVLRSLTKESEGGSSQDKNLKSITLEDKQAGEQKNWGNVVRRYKPRRVGTTSPNFSNRGEPKLALEGPPSVPEKEDEDAFSVTEFFKDMCTIWNCLATQSKTKDVKANQKAIEDKSEEPLKDPLPLLPAIEHSGDKIEETSGTLDTIEKEGGSQLEVENSESEDGSETSSGGEIVDYQSMIYLPEKQLKQIGKALAALHCWYCKVKQPEKLAKCRGCRKARYCSEACHAKDWKNHKRHCNYFKMKSSKKLPAAPRTNGSSSSEVD